jgi:hypothetical protein
VSAYPRCCPSFPFSAPNRPRLWAHFTARPSKRARHILPYNVCSLFATISCLPYISFISPSNLASVVIGYVSLNWNRNTERRVRTRAGAPSPARHAIIHTMPLITAAYQPKKITRASDFILSQPIFLILPFRIISRLILTRLPCQAK